MIQELENAGGGGTNDLEGIKLSEALLDNQDAEEKTIIVITDGAGVEETADYVRKLEARGITVIAIGIGAGTEAVTEVYSNHYQSEDFRNLPKTLLRVLTRRLLNLP